MSVSTVLRTYFLLTLFALGAVSGVLLTLAMQAFFREDDPPGSAASAGSAGSAITAIAPIAIPEPEPLAGDPEPIADDEAAELADATSGIEDHAELPDPEHGAFDLLEPRGAHVRIDGVLLKHLVPIKAFPLKAGRHQLRLYVKKTRRDLVFSIDSSEHLDLTPQFRLRH